MPLLDATFHPARLVVIALAMGLAMGTTRAAGPAPASAKEAPATAPEKAAAVPSSGAPKAATVPNDPNLVVDRIRAALSRQPDQNALHVLVGDEPLGPSSLTGAPGSGQRMRASDRTRSKAQRKDAASASPPPWAYDGPNGPAHWAQLHPSYTHCASGQRQSPIRIDPELTLQGPAETLQLAYGPGQASVVHTGQALRVDVTGTHTLAVRGSQFALQAVQFHHPAEIHIGTRTHAMAAHLLHRNPQGQLAVLVLLLEPGEAHPEIHKLWTHMPLEANDRVPLPDGLLNLQALLPQDPRYYQFMGSLSAPPCTEGVLWLVMKQPVSLSPEQLRLFARLFPMNARPVQALNGRVVREGM